MARIRSVHPALFTDEAVVSCSAAARFLFIGLWTEADDQGVFEWRPLQIKMRLLPADDVNVQTLLDELATRGLIQAFTEGARGYGAIKDFRKFQRPQKPSISFYLPPELTEFVGLEDDENLPGNALRRRLVEQQQGRCFYCETAISFYSKRIDSCEIDHRVPKAKGGSDDEENLVAACRACNRGKCDRTEAEWRAILATRSPKDLFGNANPRKSNQMERRGEEDGIGGEGTRARRKPETDLPDGFPDAEAISAAQQKLSAEGYGIDAAREAERFRDHHASRGSRFRDWPAAWRTWTRNAMEFADKRGAPRGPVLHVLPVPEAQQRMWMQEFVTRGDWRPERGPRPDEPGCRVTAAIMAEFDYKPPGRRSAS